jgi:hypothetical protein
MYHDEQRSGGKHANNATDTYICVRSVTRKTGCCLSSAYQAPPQDA